jgi:hypothetical protein
VRRRRPAVATGKRARAHERQTRGSGAVINWAEAPSKACMTNRPGSGIAAERPSGRPAHRTCAETVDKRSRRIRRTGGSHVPLVSNAGVIPQQDCNAVVRADSVERLVS